MLLAIDIGNTRTNFGVFNQSGELLSHLFMPTSYDEKIYSLQLGKFWAVERVVCASVVPKATEALAKACTSAGLNLEIITPQEGLGVAFNGLDYTALGADLFVNAVASAHLWNRDTLTVDLGTASKFCVMKSGVYLGTALVPGMELSFNALIQGAALLQETPLARPDKVINGNTTQCLQAGIYYGYLELVRGMISRIKKERGELFVILTGGIGSFLVDDLRDVIEAFDPTLTLLGINIAAQKITSKLHKD
ncbi:MAG: type III pantothenate kinase [bacterium]|nr:type III pantothenate kinase [bacterium]